MAIGNCGFPPFVPTQAADGSMNFESGPDLLLRKGPTILVEVGFETSLFADPAQTQAVASSMAAGAVVASTARLVEALVDTGAGDSCIDEDLANELQLPLIDRMTCSGVGGEHELNVYLGHIRIPSLGQIRYGRFIGAKLKVGGQPHQALIGRMQISDMILIYDGRTGAVSLSI
jgi:predicted aspartyl protease